MEQRKFGDILREGRKRKGLSLAQAGERLRIRPDILQTIENSDIPNMPPRGYARNMVMGYAKFVGLDPSELAAMYNDELAHYEGGMARTQPHQAHHEPHHSQIREPRAARRAREEREGRPIPAGSYGPGRTQRMHMVEDDDDIISTRSNNYAGSRSFDRDDRRFGNHAEADRDRRDIDDDYDDYEEAKPGAVAAVAGAATGLVSKIKGDGKDKPIKAGEEGEGPLRNPAVLAGIVAVLVVIIILVLFVGRGCGKAEDKTATSSVTAATEQAATEAKETAPTSVKVAYKVDEGTEAWLEVYVDGKQQMAEQVTGPSEGSFDITGNIEIVTASATGVHITVDGKEQKLTTNESGLIDFTYSFADYLNEWNKAHGISTTSSSSSSSSSTNSSTNGTTNTSSTSTSTNSGSTSDQSYSQQSNTYSDTGYQDTSYQQQYYGDGTATTGGY